jgi:hypothetical protein
VRGGGWIGFLTFGNKEEEPGALGYGAPLVHFSSVVKRGGAVQISDHHEGLCGLA